MNWKSLLSMCESILYFSTPSANISVLRRYEAIVLIDRLKKLSSTPNHPLVSVLCTQIENCPHYLSKNQRMSYIRKSSSALPESMVIPIIGQASLSADTDNVFGSLEAHRKLGEIYASVNLALALHRSVIELPSHSDAPEKQWLETMESGNKLAILAGDVLLASASLTLAQFRIPMVLGLISGTIAEAIGAEFSGVMCGDLRASKSDYSFVLNQWIMHIIKRNGAFLGECCAAALIMNSPDSVDVNKFHSAKYFGSCWGCLARLIDERKAVRKALASGIERQKSINAIGYTQSGLPEPTLADLCLLSLGDTGSMLENMYANVAHRMVEQMRTHFRVLVPRIDQNDEIQGLALESMKLLIKDALG